jgi:adenosylcobinamide-GDP ribazoletransferase
LSFLAALKFLTIIRIPARREASGGELGRSAVYFPVVGIIIGLSLAGLNWLFGLGFPQALVNVLLIGWMVIISGGLHLDGLADTCDGIGGQKSTEARLEVMRDSRVGGFGVIGIALLLLVKYVSLNSIPVSMLTAALVIIPVISRWTMVYAIFVYPYARPSGLGTVFKKEMSGLRFTLATIVTLAVAALALGWGKTPYAYLSALLIMAGSLIVVVALAGYLKRKLGGLTGDTYGAFSEVTDVVILVLISLLANHQWLGLA